MTAKHLLDQIERGLDGVTATEDKPKPVCKHVHYHVVCAGRGAAFNVYRCRYCGDEEWL